MENGVLEYQQRTLAELQQFLESHECEPGYETACICMGVREQLYPYYGEEEI